MLEVKNLNVSYGVIPVLHDVSLSIRENELVALLGSNGAGKSTLLNTIQGIIKPSSGSILFLGKPIQNLPPTRSLPRELPRFPRAGGSFPT